MVAIKTLEVSYSPFSFITSAIQSTVIYFLIIIVLISEQRASLWQWNCELCATVTVDCSICHRGGFFLLFGNIYFLLALCVITRAMISFVIYEWIKSVHLYKCFNEGKRCAQQKVWSATVFITLSSILMFSRWEVDLFSRYQKLKEERLTLSR